MNSFKIDIETCDGKICIVAPWYDIWLIAPDGEETRIITDMKQDGDFRDAALAQAKSVHAALCSAGVAAEIVWNAGVQEYHSHEHTLYAVIEAIEGVDNYERAEPKSIHDTFEAAQAEANRLTLQYAVINFALMNFAPSSVDDKRKVYFVRDVKYAKESAE